MKIIRKTKELQNWVGLEQKRGRRIGLVPTMGSVHSGHLSLVDLLIGKVDSIVATIFVNPLQFSPNEDFRQYPRDEIGDCALFKASGVDILFIPEQSQIYRPNHSTIIDVGRLGQLLEGEFRPGFFNGVATVVAKLLVLIQPYIAVFGEKDYQQLCVIKQMVIDIGLPTKILGAKTVREADGLAISSRNCYLSVKERECAPELYKVICALADELNTDNDCDLVCRRWAKKLIRIGFKKVDYLVMRDANTLEIGSGNLRKKRILVAAWLGTTRLIDNVPYC